MTGTGSLALLLAIALVAWSAWRWAAAAGLPRAGDTLVAAGLLLLTLPVAQVLVVGLAGGLTRGPILVASAATTLLAAATTARPRARARVRDGRGAVVAGLRSLLPALRSAQVLVLLLAAAVAVGYRVAIAARFPVLDWDALGYHLPMADYWLQRNRVTTGHFNFWTTIYPGGAESLVAWIGALTGSVRDAAAGQLAAAALAAGTVVALCRAAGRSLRASLVGGLLFLLAPLVLVQLSTAEVDIVAAAMLVVAWHLMLVALHGPQMHRRALLLSGLAAGMAAGVKTTNLAAVAVLGLVLLGTRVVRQVAGRRTAGSPAVGTAGSPPVSTAGPFVQPLVRDVVTFSVPALLIGGYWYVRNAVDWGNPVYPLRVLGLPGDPAVFTALGLGVDPHQVGTTNRYWALAVSWASDLHWRTYFYGSPTGGLGAQWLVVMAPAALVAVVLAARSRHRLYAWGLLVPGLLLVLVLPGAYHVRYTFYLLAVGGLGLAFVLDALPRAPRHALLALVAVAGVFSAGTASWNALDISGTYDHGFTPSRVVELMRQPDDVRGSVGLRAAFADLTKAPRGATILVPPEFGDIGQPWVLPHMLWGDDQSRRLVKADQPLTTTAQALQALQADRAQYVVVTKGTPLEASLLASPAAVHPAFDVGWLAKAWAPGPAGPAPAVAAAAG